MRRTIQSSSLLLCLAATLGILASYSSLEARSMYEGRRFYVGFMQNEAFPKPPEAGHFLSISIATCKDTRVRIVSPILNRPFVETIPANTIRDFKITVRAEIVRAGQILDQILEVTSDELITVSALNSFRTSADAMAVIPVSGWGREYVVASMPCDSYWFWPSGSQEPEDIAREEADAIQRPGQFLIMAAENGTTVSYTPSTNTSTGLGAGVTQTQILDAGQCLLIQAAGGPDGQNDISGTHVTADKEIGFISGHVRTAIPNWIEFPLITPWQQHDSKDHLCEMLPPVESWGQNFVSAPLYPGTALGDHFRIYAAEPNTTVIIDEGNSESVITITDQHVPFDVSAVNSATSWSADKPIMLVQHMYTNYASRQLTGQSPDLSIETDPAMVVLPSTEQFSNLVKFQFHDTDNLPGYKAMVYVDAAGLTSLTLNGESVLGSNPELANQRIADSDIFWVILQLSALEAYTLKTDGKVAGVLFANGDVESYAYPMGSSLIDLENPDIDPPVIGDEGSDYKCGRIEGWVLDDNHRQAGIAQIEVDESSTNNFTWTIGQIEDSTRYTNFTADVIDPMLPGRFEIVVIDISGNRNTYVFEYEPPQFDAPTGFVFDASAFGERDCQEYTLRNTGEEQMLIRRIGPSGDVRINTPDLPGFPIRLEPGESITFNVCYTPNGEADPLSGRIYVEFECGGRYWVDVEGFVEKPVIISIGHNFGDVRVGDTVYADVRVVNAGNVPLIVNGFDCSPCHRVFRFPGNPFPFTLQPGDTTRVRVCFSPDEVDFFSRPYSASNDRALDNEFLITGSGIEPTIEIAGIDWRGRRVGTIHDSTITIRNGGNASIRLLDVQSSRPQAFVLDASTAIGRTLEPKEEVTLPISFQPDQSIDYNEEVILTTDWNQAPRVSAAILGIGTLPDIVTRDIDFGQVKVGESLSLTQAVIEAGGNENLTIDRIEFVTPAQTEFAVDQGLYFRAMNLPVNEDYQIEAEFTPPAIGFFETTVRVIHDALPAFERETSTFRLIGEGFRRDTILSNIIFSVTTPPFACLDNATEVILRNPGNVALVITELDLQANPALEASWDNGPTLPLELQPGEELKWNISFRPQTSGDFDIQIYLKAQDGYEATFKDVIIVERAKLKIEFSDLTNEGHSVYPGEDIPLEFGGIIEGGMEVPFDFTMLLNYNGSSLSPTINAGTLFLTDAAGTEISLPLEIVEEWGLTRVFTQEQVNLALPAVWRAEVPFLAYLDPLPTPNVSVSVAETPCMEGSQELININLNEVCANLVRFITWVPILKVTIAPNPASHDITLRYDAPEDQYVTVSLTNTLGRSLVNEKKIFLKKGEHSHKLRCSDFPSGMYSVTIRSGTKVQQQSLLINR